MIPWWIWLIIAILGALLIGVGTLFFILLTGISRSMDRAFGYGWWRR